MAVKKGGGTATLVRRGRGQRGCYVGSVFLACLPTLKAANMALEGGLRRGSLLANCLTHWQTACLAARRTLPDCLLGAINKPQEPQELLQGVHGVEMGQRWVRPLKKLDCSNWCSRTCGCSLRYTSLSMFACVWLYVCVCLCLCVCVCVLGKVELKLSWSDLDSE